MKLKNDELAKKVEDLAFIQYYVSMMIIQSYNVV